MLALDGNTKLSVNQRPSKDGTIGWFEVPMNDLARMHERETVGDIVHNAQDHCQFDIRWPGDINFRRLG